MKRVLWGLVWSALAVFNLPAMEDVDSLRQLLTNRDDKQQIEILLKLADQYYYKDIDSALYFAHMSLAKAEVNKMPDQALLSHLRLGVIYLFLNNQSESLRNFDLADSLYQGVNSSALALQYNYFRGLSWDTGLQDLDTALIFYKKASDYSKQVNDQYYRLRILVNIGNIYLEKGQMHLAMANFMKCHDLADSLNDQKLKLYALFNIGNIYWTEENSQQAKYYFDISLSLARQIGNNHLLGSIYNNLSLIQEEYNQMDSAMFYNQKAIHYYEQCGNSVSAGHAYVNNGFLHLKKDQVDSAWFCAEKATPLIDPKINMQEKINLNNLYSYIYQSKGENKKALEYYEAAYDIAKDNMLTELEIGCLDNLSSLEEKLGNYRMANFYLKDASLLRDSVYNKERSSQMAFLLKTFELDQRKKENDLLKAQNEISRANLKHEKQRIQLLLVVVLACVVIICIAVVFFLINRQKQLEMARLNQEMSRVNRELEEVSEMKNVLFSIMGHDLKTPVTSIISLSDLMVEEESTYFEDKQKRIKFINIINDSATMLLSFLDNMVYWFRNVNGDLLVRRETIQFEEFMPEIVAWYRSATRVKGIELKLLGPADFAIQGDAHMLQTVLRNLIGNAIKYSCKQGVVEINWRQTAEQVFISVRDYGVGMSEAQMAAFQTAKFMKSIQGTSGEQGTGMGLFLCRELVKKMGGMLAVDNPHGTGTEFIIELPA